MTENKYQSDEIKFGKIVGIDLLVKKSQKLVLSCVFGLVVVILLLLLLLLLLLGKI